MPGTGLIAFGSFAFDDESADTSVLIVPSIVIGRRDGVAWITRVDGAELPAGTPVGASVRLRLREGELSAAGYRETGFSVLDGGVGYLAVFEAPAAETRPDPKAITPCKDEATRGKAR